MGQYQAHPLRCTTRGLFSSETQLSQPLPRKYGVRALLPFPLQASLGSFPSDRGPSQGLQKHPPSASPNLTVCGKERAFFSNPSSVLPDPLRVSGVSANLSKVCSHPVCLTCWVRQHMEAFSQTLSFCVWLCSALAPPGKVSGSSGRTGGGACSLQRQSPEGLLLAARAPGKARRVVFGGCPGLLGMSRPSEATAQASGERAAEGRRSPTQSRWAGPPGPTVRGPQFTRLGRAFSQPQLHLLCGVHGDSSSVILHPIALSLQSGWGDYQGASL